MSHVVPPQVPESRVGQVPEGLQLLGGLGGVVGDLGRVGARQVVGASAQRVEASQGVAAVLDRAHVLAAVLQGQGVLGPQGLDQGTLGGVGSPNDHLAGKAAV